jgi:prepilin-type N-terminal cleavage/methylation domain-containing protein
MAKPQGQMGSKAQMTNFKKGFTLLEVMIAMAILGMGLAVIIELFSGGLRLGKASKEYTKAANHGRMKLEEISAQQDIAEGKDEGEYEDGFRWQVDVKKIVTLPMEKDPDFKPPVDLFQVKINILWKSGLKERAINLESYKMNKSGGDEKKS